MMKATLTYFVLILTSCVNVSLGPSDTTNHASGVTLREPAKPFEKEDRKDVDAAWKNSRNGNVISYLSDCKDPSDPPLDSIIQGVTMGVSELQFESREAVIYQGREGRRVRASGRVDGVPTGMEMMVFKRNHCIYILSYVGVKTAFASDRDQFQKFLDGFKVP
jgi:hypothetical protein